MILNSMAKLKFLLLLLGTTILLLLAAILPAIEASRESEAIQSLVARLDTKRSTPSVQESAAKALLRRLLPKHVSSFEFRVVSKDVCGGKECFWIDNYNLSGTNSHEIIIKGTTAVELASGLHWYLKYWCSAHISWEKTGGIQVDSVPEPGSLPHVKDGGVMIQRPVPWNYYQNVVTSSYSYVWWDWEEWEKEIDWMALQGINLPLAFTGQESIWQKVFMDFNISKEELNDFFGGPAFLAWARMGNLHGWGGPLSQNWLDHQLGLQKQILSRMLELGMTPVLPSFSGNVPAALKRKFPSATITRLGEWNTVDSDPRWCCTYLLDPSDPLFVKIGEAFIKKQMKEYGDVTDIYNCDTFNENTPPTSDPKFISSLGGAVYKAMSKGDKDAVWLMQGWLFYSDSTFWKPPQMEALLHSVPFGKMVVLDLFADVHPVWNTSSQFFRIPYIWCLLHNFGGNIEMYGILDAISSGPVDARTSENSTMDHLNFIYRTINSITRQKEVQAKKKLLSATIGVGMCMEGIEQNPVVYELMSEMAYRSEKVQVMEWLKIYAQRRYGKAVHKVEKAWKILYHTIYNCTDGIADHNIDFIVKLPDWDPSLSHGSGMLRQSYEQQLQSVPVTRKFLFQETNMELPTSHLWYSTQDVVKAFRLFIDAGNDLSGSLAYRYDLVDLGRQVLSKLANQVYLDAVVAFQQKDAKVFNLKSKRFVQLIEDIDLLLASDDHFLLGTWLESAKKLAVVPSELRQYEWNARTQVTMWFYTTATNQSKLHDYANKFWSGLLKDYYLPRASTYFSHLSSSLRENKNFDIEAWTIEWIKYSNAWQEGTDLYPVKASGDAVAISNLLYEKYFS